MKILEIYEKVNLRTSVQERVFFNYLNDSVNEIAGLHGDMPQLVFIGNITAADITPIDNFDSEMILLPLYHNAVADNILFLCGHGDAYKGEFIRKTREAYLQYWNIYSKNRRIKRNGW